MCICVCKYVCVNACVCMYGMYVCMYVCVCIVYVCENEGAWWLFLNWGEGILKI